MKVMGLIALTLAVCLVSASAQPIFLLDPITPSSSARRPPPSFCCSRRLQQPEITSRINSDHFCFVTTRRLGDVDGVDGCVSGHQLHVSLLLLGYIAPLNHTAFWIHHMFETWRFSMVIRKIDLLITCILNPAEEHLLAFGRLVTFVEHGRGKLVSHLHLVSHSGVMLGAIERRVCKHLTWVPSLQRSGVVLRRSWGHDFLEERTRAGGTLHAASLLETPIENLLDRGLLLEGR